jgi:hypothetical protein
MVKYIESRGFQSHGSSNRFGTMQAVANLPDLPDLDQG